MSLVDSHAVAMPLMSKNGGAATPEGGGACLESSGCARAHRGSLGGRVLAEVQVEHVVEGAAQKEADDESDVAEGGIGVWYRTDVQAEDVGEEIDGDHQPDAHGHDSLPPVVPGVVEHAFVTVVTTAQPVVHEHDREPWSDPVTDQAQKALVLASARDLRLQYDPAQEPDHADDDGG